jgi:hypothetical protein
VKTSNAIGSIALAGLFFATGATAAHTVPVPSTPVAAPQKVTAVETPAPWVELICIADGYCQKEAHSGVTGEGDDVYALCPAEQDDVSCSSGDVQWAEDSLPGVLNYWADVKGADLVPNTTVPDQGTCWVAVTPDVSLLVCSSGLTEES